QLSPDGKWRWDGTQWVPADGPPAWAPPPTQPVSGSTPAYGVNPPPTQPVAGPTPAYGAGPAKGTLAYQFSGDALWSIIFGLASVLVPIFTPIYFPILPLFGLWRGVLACRSGRVAGGAIGLVLNVFGGLVSLLSSGLL